MAAPHITLEQWRGLDRGGGRRGYARAAATLHKSQSSVTYACRNASVLGVKAFEIQGRKAVLTPTGSALSSRPRAARGRGWRRAGRAHALSGLGSRGPRGDGDVFSTWPHAECLDRFGAHSRTTRIELVESVLGEHRKRCSRSRRTCDRLV